ncbi:MAG: ribbon-helix-helix domain-containing protein [Elusimicrobiota bacterium]
MQNSFKVAISLPASDYKKIENIRRKMKIGRSALIDDAIRFWLDWVEQQELIKQYESGYRKNPEDIQQIKVMEKLSAEAFREEDLK